MKEADEYAAQSDKFLKAHLPKEAHVYAMLAVAASIQDVYVVLEQMRGDMKDAMLDG